MWQGMYWFHYDVCHFFLSVNNFFIRNPTPIFNYSTFSESILNPVGALRKSFFYFRFSFLNYFKKPEKITAITVSLFTIFYFVLILL